MNYDSSMAGLDQIFQAILAQQMEPSTVEVDEMGMGGQGMAQDVESEEMTGSGTMMSGLDAMMQALEAAGTKPKNMPNVVGGFQPSYKPRGM